MKKLIIVALSAVLALIAVEPAQAQDQKVLAIIDTAVDSTKIPSVIYEACFTVNRSCPNGLGFMEGSGSANSKVWPADIRNTTYHGQNMASAAVVINPNVKIVFVRIADISAAGNSGQQPASLSSAIEWVSKNAAKFSIDAVSISQSGISKNNLESCSSDIKTINSVASLNAQNIPTFAATGNNKSETIVGFPSCVNGVIGVGALAAFPKTPTVYNNFDGMTNRGPGLDLVAPGDVAPRVSQTSGATVFAASSYLKSNSTTFSDFVSKLVKVLGYPYISK
jgi:hypothetical protein